MATINVTEEVLSKLRNINTDGLQTGRYNFPDFLIIGPQRTGTTWLHRNLFFNSNIFLPYNKELYFFNYLKIKDNEGTNYNSDRLEWYSRQFTPDLNKYFHKNLTLFKSYKNFRCLDYNIYAFYNPMIKGEATASYAAMEEELIKEIFVLNPSIKVILMIRNPVDRAWSHAKLGPLKKNNKTSEEINLNELRDFYTRDYIMRCGNYTTIIQNWEKYTKPGHLFIGIFDEINNNPENLLARIYKFLNIQYNLKSLQLGMFKKKINPTASKAIPHRHKAFLQDLFKEEIQELNKRFNLHWEEDYL